MNGDVDFLETSHKMRGFSGGDMAASDIQNILFIDTTSVLEYEVLVESANERTLAIPYDPTITTRREMEDILQRAKCSRVGFVFATYGDCVNTFVENLPYDDETNVEWFVEVIRKYGIQNLDFFGCKTLLYDSWKTYYGKLVAGTEVNVYANPNVTGNSEYGGDWRLSMYARSSIIPFNLLNSYFVSPVTSPVGSPRTPTATRPALFATTGDSLIVNSALLYFNSNITKYKNILDGTVSSCFIIDLSGYIWSTGSNSNSMLGRLDTIVNSNNRFFLGKINQFGASFPLDYNNTLQTVGCLSQTCIVSLNSGLTERLYYVGFNSTTTAVQIPGMDPSGSSNVLVPSRNYNNNVDNISAIPVIKIVGTSQYQSRLLTANGQVYQTHDLIENTPIIRNINAGQGYTTVVGSRFTKSSITDVSDVQVSTLDASFGTTLLLKKNGTVVGYGSTALFGTSGGLTIGTTSTNVSIFGESTFSKISMSNTHNMLLTTSGKIYCTAYNTYGQFGNTSASTSSLNNTWYQMTPPTKLPTTGAPTISTIVAGDHVSYVLYSDGSLYGCGDNGRNQINSTATASYSTLQLIIPPFRKVIKQVACLVNSTQILTTDNIPYSVGNDGTGIGIGSSTSATTFTQMSTSADRSTLMTNVRTLNTNNAPITVTSTTPTIDSIVATPGTLNSLRVTYTAINGVSDPSLSYYYYLDNSPTPQPAGSSNPFDISVTNGSHTVALVGIIYSGTTILWQSQVTPNSTGNPYFADSAPLNLSLTATPGSTTSINVQFTTPETPGNPSRSIYQYAFGDTGGTYVDVPLASITTVVSTNTFTISSVGLSEGTQYTVRIRSAYTTASPNWFSPDVSGIVTTNSKTTAKIDSIVPYLNGLTVNFSDLITGNTTTTYYYNFDGTDTPEEGTSSVISQFNISTTTAKTVYIIASNAGGNTISTGFTQTPYVKSSPPSITNVAAVNGSTTNLLVTFTDPNNGNPSTSSYSYFTTTGGSNSSTQTASVSGGQFTITGLLPGTSYTVTMYSSSTTGGWSSDNSTESSSVTTNKLGSNPTFTQTSTVANQVVVSYSQETVGTTPTTYSYYLNGVKSGTSFTTSTGTFTIPSLTNTSGTAYSLYIDASNAGGNISSASQTIYFIGTVPTGKATPGLNKLTIDFSQNILGTATTTYYYSYNSSGTGRTQITSSSSGSGPFSGSFEISSISTQQTVYIIASNAANDNLISSPITGTPYVAGSAPSGLSINPIAGALNSMRIAFSASVGGNPDASTSAYYYLYLDTNLTPFKSGYYADTSSLTISDVSNDLHTITIKTKSYLNSGDAIAGTNVIWTTADISGQGRPYYAGLNPSSISVTPLLSPLGALKYSYTGATGGNPSQVTYYYSNASNTPLGSLLGGTTDTSFNVTGLSNQNYSYYIIAVGLSGTTEIWRTFAQAPSATPYIQGSAPTISNVTAVTGSTNSLKVTFTDPTDGNPSTRTAYSYYWTNISVPGNSGYQTATVSDGSFVITGLTANTTYTVKMRSSSTTIWTSADSVTSGQVTTNNLGSNPTFTQTSTVANQVVVSYSQTTVGTTPTTYYYYLNGVKSGTSLTTSTGTFTITDLTTTTAGFYSLYILASNAGGDISSNSPQTLNFIGSRPSISSVVPSMNKLTVNFTQTVPGTSPTSYYYSYNADGTSRVGPYSSSPIDISNLTQPTALTVYIVASNPAQDNLVSTASTSTTPYIQGTAPSGLSINPVTGALGSLRATFTTPTQNGNPLSYVYYYLFVDANASPFKSGYYADMSSVTIPSLSNSQHTITIQTKSYASDADATANAGAGTNVIWTTADISGQSTPYYAETAPQSLILAATANSTTSIDVQFTTPATAGNPVRSTYQYALDASTVYYDVITVTTVGTANTFQISSGITAGQLYTVRVRSISSTIWNSPDASRTVTANKLGVATITSIDPSLNKLIVNWSKVDGIGGTQTYFYNMNGSSTDSSGTVTSSPFTISTSATTQQTVYIVASNAGGNNRSAGFSQTPYYAGLNPSSISVTRLLSPLGALKYSYTGAIGGNPSQATYYYSNASNTPLGSLLGGTTDTSFNVTGLSNQLYQYYIIAVGLSGGTEIWRTFAQAPSATPYIQGTQPSISQITSGLNTLTFTYSASSGGNPSPTYYYSSNGTTLLGTGTTGTSITLSDLSLNQNYQYYIIAVGLSGATEIWRYASVQSTGQKPYITGSSPSVTAAALDNSENAVRVTYTVSSGGNPEVTKYQYYYTPSGGVSSALTDVTGTLGDPFTISGLTANTSYRVTMRALGIISGTTIWTSGDTTSASVTTNKIGSAPVITANAIDGTTNSINVSITTASLNGNPALTKYQYSTNNGVSYRDLSGISPSYTITTDSSGGSSLVTGTTYQVLLKAVSGTAWTSSGSNVVSVTTNKIGSAPTITNVSAVNLTTNSLKVTFTGSSDGIPATTKYQYYTTPSGVIGVTDATGVLDGSFIITGLSAGTSYGVTMRALSGSAWTSAYSTQFTDVSTNKFGSQPTVTLSCPSSNQLTVAYSQSTQGTATTSYYYALNGGTLTDAPASPFTLSGLTNTSPYSVYVLARNPAGDISSNVASGNILGSTPTITSIDPSTNKIRVYFSQTSTGTATTTYYYNFDGSANTRTGGPVTSPFDISGLTQATPLTVYVVASNPAGNLVSSGSTQTPYVVGSKPVIYSITQGVNKFTVYFNGSTGANPAPTYYYSDVSNGSNLIKQVTSPFDITGLNSSMTVYIAAVNVAGMVVSDGVTGTPNTAGNAPFLNSVTPGTNKLTVAFTKDNTGWNPLPDYYYSFDGVNTVASVTTSPFDISGISTSKTVYIIATNIAGTQVSNNITATPYIFGSQPTATLVSSSAGQIRVSYAQTPSQGTAPTSYYYVLNGVESSSTISSNPFDLSGTALTGTSPYIVYIIARNPAGDISSNLLTGNVFGSTPTGNATPGLNKLTINFSQNTMGTSPTTYYYNFDGSANSRTGGPVISPFDISNISITQTVYVVASNPAGNLISAGIPGTPYYAGSAPSGLSITPRTILNSMTVAFSTPSQNGNPSAYIYYYLYLDAETNPFRTGKYSDVSSVIITGLSNDIHTITIKTKAYVSDASSANINNAIWTTADISGQGRPYYAGSAPSNILLTPVATLNSLNVRFSASSGGNPSAYTYYYLYLDADTNPFQTGKYSDVSSVLIPGLSNDIHTVIVKTKSYISDESSSNINNAIWTTTDISGQGTPYYTGTAPTITSVTPSLNSLTFAIGASVGGNPSANTYYYFYLDGSPTPFRTGKYADVSSVTVGSLSTGNYTVVVRAKGLDLSSNVIWTSSDTTDQGTPYTLGSAPTIGTITPGANQLSVEFSQTSIGSTPTTYYYSTNGTTKLGTGSTTSPLLITGISTSTTFYIIANNAAGDIRSLLSASGTPYLIGSAPVIKAVTPGKNSLIVDFSGSIGGVPEPTTYLYSLDDGAFIDANTTVSPITINKLTGSKEYAVRIVARNAGGNTAASNSVGGTPLVDTETVITPATYWTQQYWAKTNFWKRKSFWSRRR